MALKIRSSSAAMSRGLIEALFSKEALRRDWGSSAAMSRGLIEAWVTVEQAKGNTDVIRGDEPRPH